MSQVTLPPLDEQLDAIFTGPSWSRVKAQLRAESPQTLRMLLAEMYQNAKDATADPRASYKMRAEWKAALPNLRNVVDQLDDYIESRADREARRQRPGIGRFKRTHMRTRLPDEALDNIRDTVLAIDRLLGGIANGAVDRILEHRGRLSAGGQTTKDRRKYAGQISGWRRLEAEFRDADPQASKSKIYERIAIGQGEQPEFGHNVIRRELARKVPEPSLSLAVG